MGSDREPGELTPDDVLRKMAAYREYERNVTYKIRRNLWGLALIGIVLGYLIARVLR